MRRPNWSTILSCTLLGGVVLPPLIALALHSLSEAASDSPSVAAFAGMRPLVLLGRSLMLATAVGGVGASLGLLAGYAVAVQQEGRQRALLLLLLLPLLIPPFIHALSWIMFADLAGQTCHGMAPTVAVLGLAFFPLAGLLTWAGMIRTRPATEAAILAQSRFRAFWHVQFPLLRPYLLTGFLVIALFSFSDYAVPSLFRVNTYPVTVFAQFAAYYDVRGAVAASWPYFLLPLAALAAWNACVGARIFETIGGRHSGSAYAGGARHTFAWAIILGVLLVLAAAFPIGMQLVRAGGMQTYARAWQTAQRQIVTSVSLAATAATVTVAISVMAASGFRRSRGGCHAFLDYVSLLPVAIPGTLFGIGMIVLWNRPGTRMVYGTIVVVCLLYVARFIPFAFRSLVAGLQSLNTNLFDVADLTDTPASTGFVRITLPLLAPFALVGWVLCFILSLRELTGTLLVTPPGVETLGVRIYSLYHYGAGKLVAALSVFMVVGTLLVFAVAALAYKGLHKC